jgi:flagellar hook-basal body complex protein FliE
MDWDQIRQKIDQLGNFMINNTQNHLLSQMQALESLAKGQAMQPEVKTEQNQSFGDLMQQAVGKVNETQMQASSLTKAFELGEDVDISAVMIAVQKSRISFEALTQVRNKLLTAYQDVMNMSV